MRIFQTQLTADQVDTSQRHNAPVVTLSFEDRRRARQRVQLNTGEEVGIVLQTGHSLNDGDWLQDNNGQLIMVRAAQETILRVTSPSSHQLMRAAYHLGNRHVTLEVAPNYLQLEYDPVLVDMLKQLGMLHVEQVQAAFQPETGAYGGGHKHGHDESFDEDYALAQAAYAAHDPHSHEHSQQSLQQPSHTSTPQQGASEEAKSAPQPSDTDTP